MADKHHCRCLGFLDKNHAETPTDSVKTTHLEIPMTASVNPFGAKIAFQMDFLGTRPGMALVVAVFEGNFEANIIFVLKTVS